MPRAQKRKSGQGGPSAEPRAKPAKQAKKSKDAPAEEAVDPRPRLTTPDLEFDYDRSQLRDPRPTPGRVARPRVDDLSMDDDFKQRFYIPQVQKLKGRKLLTDEQYKEQSLLNPSATFHDLHVCHQKGANGSPTYDSAGFQLDWHKVNDWMKPRPYSKRRMVKGMEARLNAAQLEEEAMIRKFFAEGQGPPKEMGFTVKDYIKDHVSKDLGVPWHQIDTGSLEEWENRGFVKAVYSDWWREPTAEEKKRMSNMHSGCVLRKDI